MLAVDFFGTLLSIGSVLCLTEFIKLTEMTCVCWPPEEEEEENLKLVPGILQVSAKLQHSRSLVPPVASSALTPNDQVLTLMTASARTFYG